MNIRVKILILVSVLFLGGCGHHAGYHSTYSNVDYGLSVSSYTPIYSYPDYHHDYFYIEIIVADSSTDLVPGPASREHAVGTGDGYPAFPGKTGRHSNHILFRNTCVKDPIQPFRVSFFKIGNFN